MSAPKFLLKFALKGNKCGLNVHSALLLLTINIIRLRLYLVYQIIDEIHSKKGGIQK